ncbi:MAG: hypothetical protein N2Z81_05115 [Hydrogenothermaceae bacterium]|nr:hypothetical protein [Hydrogenothermaceae bacterium]
MEPFQAVINLTERSYTAMQGIIHFIGWSIAFIILYYVFKFVKKHNQEDERAKKYQGIKTPVNEEKRD